MAAEFDPRDNVVPALDHDVHHGFRIDGSKVQWWGTKARAREGAKAIGWPMNSIERVWTRFQCGYALHATHGGFLTREAYARLTNHD